MAIPVQLLAGGLSAATLRHIVGQRVRVIHGDAAIPVACGRAAQRLEALRLQRLNAQARRAAGLIGDDECRRRLHRIGEKIIGEERLLALYQTNH